MSLKVELILLAFDVHAQKISTIVTEKDNLLPALEIQGGDQYIAAARSLFKTVTGFSAEWISDRFILLDVLNEHISVSIILSCLINTKIKLALGYNFTEMSKIDKEEIGQFRYENIAKSLQQRY